MALIIGLPHACGGVSQLPLKYPPKKGSSPRLWGCFSQQDKVGRKGAVFPTPVGVFPNLPPLVLYKSSLPHACGGVS